ncbi:Hint domain-containing protein [Roseovarius sp. A21]|uniref:Hint domain-containing protein n=1 Tax=Roseovarius bejariae TaxID=2576383 RepID=A0A844CH29_9RHOB|nr:Hint domain-containing protein [Roseovarius bejariae]MRU13937.1 Hint domain-containing protein [Roseovarius bejariae]
MAKTTHRPAQSIPVYAAVEFSVVNGANLGDPISFAAELDQGDTYELHKHARQERLAILMDESGQFTIAADSELGRPGAALHLDCCLTMMAGTGQTTEILVLVEVDDAGCVADVYILPLADLIPRMGYALVGIDRENARRKFAEVGCVSFSRGTHITMASGEQRAIEDLRVGDMVLTRDDGAQQVHWIGASTVRAVGEFAPIRIKAGTLHNENDLRVSPDHRLFIYQRSDALGAGRNEVLVRARHLVNGDTVVQEDGGFVDYFQLLFDTHQIIYAEGIAAETLLVDPRTRPALPEELSEKLAKALPGHDPAARLDYEVTESLLDHPNAADLLKRASTR